MLDCKGNWWPQSALGDAPGLHLSTSWKAIEMEGQVYNKKNLWNVCINAGISKHFTDPSNLKIILSLLCIAKPHTDYELE